MLLHEQRGRSAVQSRGIELLLLLLLLLHHLQLSLSVERERWLLGWQLLRVLRMRRCVLL